LHKLKLPRICINNDPRTYPRDQEMSFGWDHCRPAALLDQCERDVPMIVGGKNYRRVSRYAAAQSWSHLPMGGGLSWDERKACKIVAHCHVEDGCKQRGRRSAWESILGEDVESWEIYGSGWSALGRPDVVKIRPDEALGQFASACCTPCVSPSVGFYSGKAWVALSQGCIPVPYGDGTDPYTWDPLELYVPFREENRRCVVPGDLKRISEELHRDQVYYESTLAMYRDVFVKDFTLLDRVIDDLLAGTFKAGRYGGYMPC
jgi:hypothetical protein